MTELSTKDLHWILRRAPKRVLTLMQKNPNVFMAGGFIRACVANEEVQDVDLFAPDEERAGLYAAILAGQDGKVFKSANAYTIRVPSINLPIQVIHRWTYTKPEELIESFDFTVAKTVVWYSGSTWQSLAHVDFYADLAAKRLTYTKPQRNEDAGGSLLRVLKFYQKGYRIPLDSMAAVVARLVMGVNMDRVHALSADKEEAIGMALTGLLHEVDPLQDPQHLFHLPSETEVSATT